MLVVNFGLIFVLFFPARLLKKVVVCLEPSFTAITLTHPSFTSFTTPPLQRSPEDYFVGLPWAQEVVRSSLSLLRDDVDADVRFFALPLDPSSEA
jgi:hypothetical protein